MQTLLNIKFDNYFVPNYFLDPFYSFIKILDPVVWQKQASNINIGFDQTSETQIADLYIEVPLWHCDCLNWMQSCLSNGSIQFLATDKVLIINKRYEKYSFAYLDTKNLNKNDATLETYELYDNEYHENDYKKIVYKFLGDGSQKTLVKIPNLSNGTICTTIIISKLNQMFTKFNNDALVITNSIIMLLSTRLAIHYSNSLKFQLNKTKIPNMRLKKNPLFICTVNHKDYDIYLTYCNNTNRIFLLYQDHGIHESIFMSGVFVIAIIKTLMRPLQEEIRQVIVNIIKE